MTNFKFERNQTHKISRKKIISELERVAKHFGYVDFKKDDFNQMSEISYDTVYREFGSWEKTMDFLVDHFKSKSITFNKLARRSNYSEKEMFDEMERIWSLLDHRPSRDEWVACKGSPSYDTLYRHFGSWTKACLEFVEYKSGKKVILEEKPKILVKKNKEPIHKKKTNARTISLRTRLQVMKRDNFKCVFCGKNPATNPSTKLHIDHIKPFSKGGSNDHENLQTLCEECNLGKSNINI